MEPREDSPTEEQLEGLHAVKGDVGMGEAEAEALAQRADEIREALLAIGRLEEESGVEEIFDDEEARGAEHLRAAEGIMTFRTLNGDGGGEPDPWMKARLESIAAKHRTGHKRPQRSGFARRLLGSS